MEMTASPRPCVLDSDGKTQKNNAATFSLFSISPVLGPAQPGRARCAKPGCILAYMQAGDFQAAQDLSWVKLISAAEKVSVTL